MPSNLCSMWANVWYYLDNQLITLAAAFGLSLCFESPFIRLEKLWIGALLKAVLPVQGTDGKSNKINGTAPPEHQKAQILDDNIECGEMENLEMKKEKEDIEIIKCKGQDEFSSEFKGSIAESTSVRADDLHQAQSEAHYRKGIDVEATGAAVAEMQMKANLPSYEETIKQ